MDKICVICRGDFGGELGCKYCGYCVNNEVILINQYYSRLDNEKTN